MKNRRMSTRTMALCAIMTALVVILQFLGAFIKLGPFSVSLVLLPIVIGTATCGVGAGMWLGLIFGLVVLWSGDAGAFLAVNVPGTIITVLLKGIACGLFAGIAYKVLSKYNTYLAVITAAIVCPLVNTGVFLLGCRLFFWETIAIWGAQLGFLNAASYAFFGLAGGNFIFELILNIILSPAVVRLLNIKNR